MKKILFIGRLMHFYHESMLMKNFIQNVFASIEALFMTAIRDWRNSASVEGLRDVEKELYKHYIFKYSPIFVHQDRIKTHYSQVNFTYGEIPHSVSKEIVETAKITDKDVVYDLGCGRGKFLFFVNLFTGARCIGVDLLPTYISIAEKITEKLNLRKIHFFEEDILDVDLRTASVVFIHGTSFTEDLREGIRQKIEELRNGSRLISVTKPFEHPHLKLDSMKKMLISWGLTQVFFYSVEKQEIEETTETIRVIPEDP